MNQSTLQVFQFYNAHTYTTIASCNGISNLDPNVCSGHGTCVSENVCECHFGYGGKNCEHVCTTSSFVDAIYSPNGKKISVTFANDLDVDVLVPKNCGSLLHNSTLSMLGTNPTCVFVTKKLLEITVGSNPRVSHRPTITILPNSVKAHKGDLECGAHVQGDIVLSIPDEAAAAPTAVLRAPKKVANCSPYSLELDASSSFGPGTLEYEWTMVQDVQYQYSPEIQSFLASQPRTASRVTITTLLPVGLCKFEVTVINELSQTSKASVVVEQSDSGEVPSLMIEPVGDRYTHQEILLYARASLPCGAIDLTKSFIYDWQCTSHPDLILPESRTKPTLVIPPYTLTPGVTYVFELEIQLDGTTFDDFAQNATDTVTVNVLPSPVKAIIKGLDETTLSTVSTLKLDGSESRDPDYNGPQNPDAKFQWTCCLRTDQGCDFSQCAAHFPTLGQASAVFTQTATESSKFPTGTWEFHLEYRVGTRTDTTHVSVEFKDMPLPTVSILNVPKPYVSHKPLSLHGVVTGIPAGGQVKYEWSVTEGSLNLQDPSVAPRGPTEPVLFIKERKLTQSRYKFTLTVTVGTQTSVTSVVIEPIQPPTGGSLSVSPDSAASLDGAFVLTTSGWTSTEEFHFIYYVVQDGIDVPLHNDPTPSVRIVVAAPASETPAADFTYKVVAIGVQSGAISEPVSATASVSGFVTNLPKPEYAASRLTLPWVTNTQDFDRFTNNIFGVAKVVEMSTETSPDVVQARTAAKNQLLDLFIKEVMKNLHHISSAQLQQTLSVLSSILILPNEFNTSYVGPVIDVLKAVTTPPKDKNRQVALPQKLATDIVNALGNLVHDKLEKSQSEKLLQTINNIVLLSSMNAAPGDVNRISTSRLDIAINRLLQSQAQSLKDFAVSTANSNALSVTLSADTFNDVDPAIIATVDVVLIQFKSNNPYEYGSTEETLTSDVVDVTLMDANGEILHVSEVRTSPILIKIPSSIAETGKVVCKFFDPSQGSWVQNDQDVKVHQVEDKSHVICSTSHLTSFATFAHGDPSGPNMLYLLFLLLLVPVAVIAIGGIGVGIWVIIRKRSGKSVLTSKYHVEVRFADLQVNDFFRWKISFESFVYKLFFLTIIVFFVLC